MRKPANPLRHASVVAVLILAAGTIGCQASAHPATQEPSATLEPTPARTSTPAPTGEATAEATAASLEPTSTPVGPSASPTVGPTPSPARTPARTAAPTRKPTPRPAPRPTASAPCSVFPSSNVWNKRVDGLRVASNSVAMIDAIGVDAYLHPDFDAIGDGIPYNVVTSSTPRYNVSFYYPDESDPGPYPILGRPRIEAGSDRHMLMIDTSACRLWEIYDASKSGSSWSGGSGAIWDLRSNALRPKEIGRAHV